MRLEVTHADGTAEDWYLDRNRHLPLKRTTEAPEGEFKAALTWYFDDYREVAGVQMPFYVLVEELLFAREYLFDDIEAGVEVPEGYFTQPEGTATPAE